jgi:aminopeptidase
MTTNGSEALLWPRTALCAIRTSHRRRSLPRRTRVASNGIVRCTKPLSYQGTLIKGIAVRFADGGIVEAKADKGQDLLRKVLDTDEGARRLGEVALVPESSPIAKSGLLFYNILYDENAASHIALGQAYSRCFVNGT